MTDDPKTRRAPRAGRLQRRLHALRHGVTNAVELLRHGRLGAPDQAPHDVHHEGDHYTLRRYRAPDPDALLDADPLLLIPPLMVTSEIYDISPELSAVSWLGREGIDVWLVDFGPPEQAEGGMTRTLDDHILAVDDAVTRVIEATGRDVHLAGYSQGGMFAYQAAAYRRAERVASLITFGSPVDIHRNLPVKVHDDLIDRVVKATNTAIAKPMQRLEALPATLTSRGFKLLNPAKEARQILDLFGLLHDREALRRREPKRAFLGGEGFVAWPGPAFRDFVSQVVVENRMAQGGFVVAGRAVTLADIDAPVLCFIGTRDELARPASVRAIARAAPRARVEERTIPAGHFGLVVGSRAMGTVWPSVVRWIVSDGASSHEAPGAEDTTDPDADTPPNPDTTPDPNDQGALASRPLYALAIDLADGVWHRLGEASLDVVDVVDTLRWQIPRIARMESLRPETRISPALALTEQARAIPDATCFLWRGNAFTYAQVNARVDRIHAALWAEGVRPDQRVGLIMSNRPDALSAMVALNRLGAVAVLIPPTHDADAIARACAATGAEHLIADAPHLDVACAAWHPHNTGPVLSLGGAPPERERVAGLRDHIRATTPPPLPDDASRDAGKASALAMLLVQPDDGGPVRAARISNRRWAVAALASAALGRLTASDTVYCSLPLAHPIGLLVATGGAIVGGCRLALTPNVEPDAFWDDVRRAGATVVFFNSDLCRALVDTPPVEGEHRNPVRLWAGQGLSPDVGTQMMERFGQARVLSFYGSPEGNAALVQSDPDKLGSLGRPLGPASHVALIALNPHDHAPIRDPEGRCVRAVPGASGELITRVDDRNPLTALDGYDDPDQTEALLLRDVFEQGDVWCRSGDLLRRDADGDYWWVAPVPTAT